MSLTLDTKTIGDIATRDLITLDPDMSLKDAIALLDHHGIHGAPVIGNGALLGVLTATDILSFAATVPSVSELQTARAPEDEGDQAETWREDQPVSAYFTDFWDDAGTDVAERIHATEGPEWDVLEEHVVSEVMSMGMRGLQTTVSLPEAAAYLLRHEIHRALVLDEDRLVGVVSAIDFLRALAGPLYQENSHPRQSRPAARRPARRPRPRRKETPAAD